MVRLTVTQMILSATMLRGSALKKKRIKEHYQGMDGFVRGPGPLNVICHPSDEDGPNETKNDIIKQALA